MGRRPSAIKQAATEGEKLAPLETKRRLAHGADDGLAGVEAALRMVAVAPDLETMPGAAGFLVRWLVKAAESRDGERLNRLAARVSRRGLWEEADPIASCLRDYAIQCGIEGETPRETLRRLSRKEIDGALAARGIHAPDTTVRNTLNRIGVTRKAGRPKKPLDS